MSIDAPSGITPSDTISNPNDLFRRLREESASAWRKFDLSVSCGIVLLWSICNSWASDTLFVKWFTSTPSSSCLFTYFLILRDTARRGLPRDSLVLTPCIPVIDLRDVIAATLALMQRYSIKIQVDFSRNAPHNMVTELLRRLTFWVLQRSYIWFHIRGCFKYCLLLYLLSKLTIP